MKGIAESNFQNIKIIIGNQVYEFFGSEFNAVYSDSKLIVNGKILTPTKEESRTKGFKNEIILNDGSVIKCNVEEIGESFIIIETKEGKRRLKKSEISKIRSERRKSNSKNSSRPKSSRKTSFLHLTQVSRQKQE